MLINILFEQNKKIFLEQYTPSITKKIQNIVLDLWGRLIQRVSLKIQNVVLDFRGRLIQRVDLYTEIYGNTEKNIAGKVHIP